MIKKMIGWHFASTCQSCDRLYAVSHCLLFFFFHLINSNLPGLGVP